MYEGTPDGSAPRIPEDLRRRLNPTGKEEVDELIRRILSDVAITYSGIYPREVMEVALKSLVSEENEINCNFLVQLIGNAAKDVKPMYEQVEGKKEDVYFRASEINGILKAFRRMELLTYDFLQGEILWVCQKQPSGGFCSCLTMLPTSSSFTTQLYFISDENGKKMAINFAKAFAADKRSGGKDVYLKKVTKIPDGFRVEDLAIFKCA
ncbi:MAG: hypothetical protein WCQ96_05650 [Patescibacteria group bacterium]